MDWKQRARQLHGKKTIRYIAEEVGKPKSTVHDYLSGKTKGDKEINPIQKGEVGILMVDLETAPTLSYHWDMWKTNIPTDFVVRHNHLLSFACKFVGNDAVCVRGLPEYKTYGTDKFDDRELVLELYKIISSADIIVAHNLDGFDEGVMNSRFIYHGLYPPPPYKSVDTLKTSRRHFRFLSNKLDYLSRFFRIGKKREHSGARLWRRCLEADTAAWETMLEYNTQDIVLLEELYMLLRPWDKKHPNVSLMLSNEKKRCVVCGSTDLEPSIYTAYTGVSVFETYRCGNCGKMSRARENLKSKDDRRNILTNIT